MHHISELSIANYRSIKDCKITLSSFTPLVGYNNAGKSNVLNALQWLVNGGNLKEEEFNNPLEPVVVTGVIDGVDEHVLGRLADRHSRRIEPYCKANRVIIRRTQEVPNSGARGVVLEIRNPDVAADAENAWVVSPAGIPQAITALFPEPVYIGAMEDVAEDVGKSKTTTTIGKLLAKVIEPVERQHGQRISDSLRKLEASLAATGEDRVPELTAVDSAASAIVEEFFSGVRLEVHIPTPDLKDIFKGGTIRVFEGGEIEGRDITAFGHGAQRSIQMALVRFLAETSNSQPDSGRTLLIIDEPELYLHPQAVEKVRIALKSLSSSGYQVVFSTHSPQMIKAEDLGATVIVRKDVHQGTHALPTLREAIAERIADNRSQAQTLFELSNSAQILFSDRVVLVEGATERRLLPEIFHLRFGATLAERRIAFVSLGGVSNVPKALSILEAMGIPTKALVDLDFVFRGAVKAGFIDREDEHICACRDICNAVAERHGLLLSDDGFPMKGNGFSASDGFALLAEDSTAQEHIKLLHDQLRNKGVWIWPLGAVEHHLGLDAKGEFAWFDYIERLRNEGCEVAVSDLPSVDDFFEWCQS